MLAVTLLAVALVRAGPVTPTPWLALLGLGGIAVARLNPARSVAFGFVLAACGAGVAPAAILLLSICAARWSLRDLLPGAASLALATLPLGAPWPLVAALAAFLALSRPEPLEATAACLGAATGLLAPPLAYLAGVTLAGLQAWMPRSMPADRAERELRDSSRALAQGSQNLARATQERRLLEELARTLGESQSVAQVVQLLLKAVRELVPVESVAIFREGLPVGWHSPHAEALAGEALARTGEPLVQRCLESGQVVAGQASRLFGGERVAVALPLADQGALYAGRMGPPFSELEREFLVLIAGAGGLGLQSASRFETRQLALEQHAAEATRLEVRGRRLAFLLEGARRLAADLSLETLPGRLEELLFATLPHEAGAVLAPGKVRHGWPAGYWTQERRAACGELASLLAANRAPLLVDDPATFRGPALGRFMACPLIWEGQVMGVLVLCGGPFAREQLDVLQLIAERATVALENASLHQTAVSAQAQVVETSKLATVGQLAAGVAHELNTPLCSVLVGIEMALACLDDPDKLDARLATAESAGERCRDIIAKLLYYARDAATGEQRYNLNQLVEDTLELLGGQLRGPVTRRLASGLPDLVGNASEMQQVLSNLLLNARDVAPGVPIEVVSSVAGDGLSVQVRDGGPGMSDEVARRAFEPFFTTRPAGRGTGLGLPVSREIAERAGGSLTFVTGSSGTTFTLWLPLPARKDLAAK